MKAAQNTNKVTLPAVKSMTGLRIPHDRSNFLQTNYRLRTDLVIIHFLNLLWIRSNYILYEKKKNTQTQTANIAN